MNTTRLLAAMAVSLIPGATLAQNAPPPCKPTSEVAAFLEERYGEVLVSQGLFGDGSGMLSIYMSQTGTWSAIVDRADGMSCLTAYGEAWTTYTFSAPKQGTDG